MAIGVGIARSTFHRRRRREQWQELVAGTWLVPGAPAGRSAWLHAALLSIGGDAALSHWSAAGLNELVRRWSSRDAIDIVIPRDRRVRPRCHVRVHTSRSLADSDLATVSGLVVTSPARTILDIAGHHTTSQLLGMALHARQRGALGIDDLLEQLDRRPNAAGAGRLRDALEEIGNGDEDSILELRTRQLLVDNGLASVTQHPVVCHDGRVRTVDLAFPAARLALECDGRAHHSDPRAFELDRHRWRHIQAADWKIIWVTWRMLRDEPHDLLADVRRHLEASQR